MTTRGQQDIVLILLRDLAEKLATPIFLADGDGKVVFYNEAAELVIGRKFSDQLTVLPDRWTDLLRPVDLDGTPLRLEEVPPGAALLHRRPAHKTLRITGLDGVERTVAATAFPLLTSADGFAGVLAIFWEAGDEDPAP